MTTILNIIYAIELILFIYFSIEWVQARNKEKNSLEYSINMLIISSLMVITAIMKMIIK